MEKLQRAADVFRAAIVARQWERAEKLLLKFRAAVEAAWSSVENDDERDKLQAEVCAILEWARAMTLTDRAQARQKLGQIVRRSAYLGTPRQRTNIHLDA